VLDRVAGLDDLPIGVVSGAVRSFAEKRRGRWDGLSFLEVRAAFTASTQPISQCLIFSRRRTKKSQRGLILFV
jgi:hypothetical protein